jgi:hypothetical protein
MLHHPIHAPSLTTSFVLLLGLLTGACGGGGGSGGTTPQQPPTTPPSDPPVAAHAGLLSLCAGDAEVRLHWNLPGSGYEAALFQGSSSTTVISGSPLVSPLPGSGTTVAATNGTETFFAMGIRPTGQSTWSLAGLPLRAVPNAPIYVDAAQTGGNGTSANPYGSLGTALQAAALVGGGNIWIRDGSYTGPFVVQPGVHVFGGFPRSAPFTLSNRNPEGLATTCTAGSLQSVFDLSIVGDRSVLDGIVVDGRSTALYGIDTEDNDIDLRSVTVTSCVDRGIRMRNSRTTEEAVIQMVNCRVQSNGADGASLQGPYRLTIDYCSFDSNVQEGLDCGNLDALNGGTSTLHVTASRFFGNGAEGLDASIAQPLGATTGSGRFEILIQNCLFEANAFDGLLLDQEHEAAPGWYANIIVRDSTARDNGRAGVHIDADADGDYLLHRVLTSANGTDGLWVSSETHAGHVIASACAFVGNLGAGARASLGNKAILTSHCLFAGNRGGGIATPLIEAAATSGIAHLQTNAFANTRQFANATVTSAAAALFENAPREYLRVTAETSGTLTVDPAPHVAVADHIEIGDDGVSRSVTSVVGSAVTIGSTPDFLRLPATLFGYGAAASVLDDLRLAAGNTVAGTGMAEAGAAAVDPGPLGAPNVTTTPGTGHAIPASVLWLQSCDPAVPTGPTSSQDVVLEFSAAIDVATITPTSLRVTDDNGTPVTALANVSGNQIILTPPGGGWGANPLRIELHAGIASVAGTGLSHPMIVPLNPR